MGEKCWQSDTDSEDEVEQKCKYGVKKWTELQREKTQKSLADQDFEATTNDCSGSVFAGIGKHRNKAAKCVNIYEGDTASFVETATTATSTAPSTRNKSRLACRV